MVSAFVEIPSEVGNGFDVRADRLVGIVPEPEILAQPMLSKFRLGHVCSRYRQAVIRVRAGYYSTP